MINRKLLILILLQTISVTCLANFSNFKMYINSYTNSKKHNFEYYSIVETNHPKNNKGISKNVLHKFPHYFSVGQTVEKALKAYGYKLFSFDPKKKESYINKLAPIYINFSYMEERNVPTVLFQLSVSEYNVPNQKNSSLKFTEALQELSKKNANIQTSKIWEILLIVEDELVISNELLLNSMIKCAATYFNENFKGIVNCER
ncbi:MAG TPA: hypothetical protein PLB74_02585 [Candidatus Paceibacterota bacterium]|nr:hypothetical protein [Candidatus Paceibacterota bacterium]